MTEALVALLTAVLLGAAQLLREALDRRRRRAGRVRTRRGDWDPARSSGGAVWVNEDQAGDVSPPNGHADPRS